MSTRYPNACPKELKKKIRETLSYVTNPSTALKSRNIRQTTGGQRSITVMSGNDRPVTRGGNLKRKRESIQANDPWKIYIP